MCKDVPHKEEALFTEMPPVLPFLSFFPFSHLSPRAAQLDTYISDTSYNLSMKDILLQKVVPHLASSSSAAQIRFEFILSWMQTDVVEFSLSPPSLTEPFLLLGITILAGRLPHLSLMFRDYFKEMFLNNSFYFFVQSLLMLTFVSYRDLFFSLTTK